MKEDNRHNIHKTNSSQDIINKTSKEQKNLAKKNAPPYCSLEEIKKILVKIDDFDNKLIDKIIIDEEAIEFKKYMNSPEKNDNVFKQENSIDLKNEEIKEKNNVLNIKRGRKKKHHQYSYNHIIIRIKYMLLNYCFEFVNRMIYKSDEKGLKLLRINYKYLMNLNRKMNLNLFKMTLQQIFSLDISHRYSKFLFDHNKKLINEILEQKIEIEDFDTIKFIFNITFNDWIDLFTYKKDLFTLVKEYNAVNVNYTKIQNNFIGINHSLNKILEYGDHFYSLFLYYAFNFQRWFLFR